MILFGGRSRATSVGAYTNYNDVWALDLNTLRWEELVSSGPAPKARSNPAGGFNPVTNEMIVVGGNTSTSGLSFAPHNDVWAFHLERNKLTWDMLESQMERVISLYNPQHFLQIIIKSLHK